MRKSRIRLALIFIATIASVSAAVVALGLFMPIPDLDGSLELSTIDVTIDWREVPLADAIDKLNREISKHDHIRARIYLHPDLDLTRASTVTLQIENVPVDRCAGYLAEVSTLFLYSVPDGLMIDYFHQDHRSWRKKCRDWVRHVLLRRWYGSMLMGS